jgi:hypothetical protein
LVHANCLICSNCATRLSYQACDENTITVLTWFHALSEKFVEPSQHQTGSSSETIPFVWQM